MQNYGKNYMEIDTMSPFTTGFMYFDHREFVADQIFIDAQLRAKFYKDAVKDGEEYVICMVKVKKKYRDVFVRCMDELRNEILLLDGKKYDDFCKEMIRKIEEEHEKKHNT